MTDKKISIILVDDHPLLRKALKDVLDEEPDLNVIAEAADGEEAVKLSLELAPDIVIMDISMPKLNGLEAIKQIKSLKPGIIIMALTVHVEDEFILEILQAGAAGYLVKSVYGKEVVQAIKAVASGDMVFSPAIGKNLLKHAAKYPVRPVALQAGEKLSIREMEILKLTAHGKSNQDIANTLNLNLRTVKGYLTEVFSKLNVSSRTEAVITALRAGIITTDDIQ
ncbi:MAG TPA: response regulator transcription factor [Dehalococcoidia bacterium]|nr:response regulator transcription factor [Dehalococcoidia bacterium]